MLPWLYNSGASGLDAEPRGARCRYISSNRNLEIFGRRRT